MRRLPALLLACALLVIVCVPTTHAWQYDQDRPLPHLVFQASTPEKYDDVAWVDVKGNRPQPWSIWDHLRLLIRLYPYLNTPSPVNPQLEATSNHANDQRDPSSGASRAKR